MRCRSSTAYAAFAAGCYLVARGSHRSRSALTPQREPACAE